MPRLAKILIRQGTTTPAAGDFDVAEPAWDKSAGKLYIKNAAGSMVEIGGGGGGGGTAGPILQAAYVISQNITLAANYHGLSLTSVEVGSGYSVEVPSGATWTIAAL
jgi:hypothetical protein